MSKGKDLEPDTYIWLMDPDPVPGGPKTCGSWGSVSGSGFRTLNVSYLKTSIRTWWSTEILTTLASEKPRHTADSSLVGRNSSPRVKKLVIRYGTVHNVLCRKKAHQFISVLRIRDVYPGSRILIFTHPGSRIQKQVEKRGVKKKFLSNIFL